MESLSCTAIGQNNWNTAWVGYGVTHAYAGTGNGIYYAYLLKFDIPEFIGVSSRLTFNLCFAGSSGKTASLRYAVATSDENMNLYANTNEEVVDSYQITSGVITTSTITSGVNYQDFVIHTTGITSGGTYYLYLWGYAPSTSPESITIQAINYHTVTMNFNKGLIYIDNGSGFDAYMLYIDNGTGWDQYIPYIDNGTGWDICG